MTTKFVQIIDQTHEYYKCTGVADNMRKNKICVYLNEDIVYVDSEQLKVLSEEEHVIDSKMKKANVD